MGRGRKRGILEWLVKSAIPGKRYVLLTAACLLVEFHQHASLLTQDPDNHCQRNSDPCEQESHTHHAQGIEPEAKAADNTQLCQQC